MISLIGLCGVVIFTSGNPEDVFAFKPRGSTETVPAQPLEQPSPTPSPTPASPVADFTQEIVVEPEDGTYISPPRFQTSPDSDSKWAILEPPSHGTLSFFSPRRGSVDYTSYPGFEGKDSFTLTYDGKTYLTSITVGSETATGTPTPTPTPSPASSMLSSEFGLDKTQDLVLEDGTSYPIKYKIAGGQVSNMGIERSSSGAPSLFININTRPQDSDGGKIAVEVPNTVLDSNGSFYAYDNVSPTEWKKLTTDSNSAIIEVEFFNFQPELRTIEILGAG